MGRPHDQLMKELEGKGREYYKELHALTITMKDKELAICRKKGAQLE